VGTGVWADAIELHRNVATVSIRPINDRQPLAHLLNGMIFLRLSIAAVGDLSSCRRLQLRWILLRADVGGLTPEAIVLTIRANQHGDGHVANRKPPASRALSVPPLSRPAVAPGHIRIGPAGATPSVIADLGFAPEPLLAEFGLDLATFTDPERRVPYRTIARLFGRCVEATSCGHFGLLVGSRAGLSSLGLVGYLASSAPTVGTALEIIRQANSVSDAGGAVTLDAREHTVSLGYEVVEPGVEHADQLAAAAIAIGFNILRALCGPQWQPHDVQFSFAAPRALTPFRKVFSLTPRFDQERSTISFPAHWLARPPPGADPILHRMMKERIEELLTEDADGVVGRVRRLLRATVTTGRSSIDDAAATLRVSTRTLKRRLACAGTTFQQLRDEVQFELACQLLRNTTIPAGQIASIVGYSESSSFNRAFRRWAGVPPAEWRQRQSASEVPAAG
jgi:AraC-like DNA-binding protein